MYYSFIVCLFVYTYSAFMHYEWLQCYNNLSFQCHLSYRVVMSPLENIHVLRVLSSPFCASSYPNVYETHTTERKQRWQTVTVCTGVIGKDLPPPFLRSKKQKRSVRPLVTSQHVTPHFEANGLLPSLAKCILFEYDPTVYFV